jgi:hypothetical protein
MPFSNVGVYTPATGALTAAPGGLIQSAIWNGIFTDLTAALTSLGAQTYGSTSVIATPYVPLAADTFLAVNFAGAVAINLPSAASRAGYPLTVKDISGAANTNNITINRNGADTIEGATSLVINLAWGAYKLKPVTGGWVIVP